jgi:hypothetical protein
MKANKPINPTSTRCALCVGLLGRYVFKRSSVLKKVFIVLVLLISGCKSTSEFYTGENLLQPMPLPEDSWTAYEKQEGNVYSRIWSKNDDKDQMKTDVFRNTKSRDIGREKEIDDKVGSEKCDNFSSSEINKDKESKYNSLTWFSSCKTKSGIEISVLHKAISGNDSFYHLRRIWKAGYSKDALATWTNYFATVAVCDTRTDSSESCPDGFKKVQ